MFPFRQLTMTIMYLVLLYNSFHFTSLDLLPGFSLFCLFLIAHFSFLPPDIRLRRCPTPRDRVSLLSHTQCCITLVTSIVCSALNPNLDYTNSHLNALWGVFDHQWHCGVRFWLDAQIAHYQHKLPACSHAHVIRPRRNSSDTNQLTTKLSFVATGLNLCYARWKSILPTRMKELNSKLALLSTVSCLLPGCRVSGESVWIHIFIHIL